MKVERLEVVVIGDGPEIDPDKGGVEPLACIRVHTDGGVSGLTYLAPEPYLFLTAGKRVPMTRLYVVLNGKAGTEFSLVDRVGADILGRSISIVRRASTAAPPR